MRDETSWSLLDNEKDNWHERKEFSFSEIINLRHACVEHCWNIE